VSHHRHVQERASSITCTNRKRKLREQLSCRRSTLHKSGLCGTYHLSTSTEDVLQYTSSYYFCRITILGSATAGLNTASVYKQFGASHALLNDDNFMALVGGLGALCNGLGRLFWGKYVTIRILLELRMSEHVSASVGQCLTSLTYFLLSARPTCTDSGRHSWRSH
jgi:hypothetical protein